MTLINEPLANDLKPLTIDNNSDNVTARVDRIDLRAVTGSTPFTIEFPDITNNEPIYSQLAGTLFGAFCADIYPSITSDAPTDYNSEVIYATEILDSNFDGFGGYTFRGGIYKDTFLIDRYRLVIDELTYLFNESNISDQTGIIQINGIDVDGDGNAGEINGDDDLTSRDVQRVIWELIQEEGFRTGGSGFYGTGSINTATVENIAGQLTSLADDFNSTGIGYLQTQRNQSLAAFGDEVTGFEIPVFVLNGDYQPQVTSIEFESPPPVEPEPDITITKEFVSAVSPDGQTIITDSTEDIPVGYTLNYQIKVTNTGEPNTDLTNVVVTDNNFTPDDTDDVFFTYNNDPTAVLAVGETWTIDYQTTAQFTGNQVQGECEPCDFVINDAFSGQSVEVTITLEDFLDDPATSDVDESGVRVTVAVTDPNYIGDIRGVFFDVADDNISAENNDIEGMDVTDELIDPNNVLRLSNDVLMRGGGTEAFDAGVEIGSRGISNDDIRSTSFDIQGLTSDDLLGQRFGVRLTSVGEEGGSREESSKITGFAPSECYCEETETLTNVAGVTGVYSPVPEIPGLSETVSDGYLNLDGTGGLFDYGYNSSAITVVS